MSGPKIIDIPKHSLPEMPDDQDFGREYSPMEILGIAHQAQSMQGTPDDKMERLRREHPDFWMRYPKVLEMCCAAGGCDMQRLGFMLSMLGEVQKGVRTLNSADEAVHASLTQDYLGPFMKQQEQENPEDS